MTQYDVHEIDRLEKAKNKWRGTQVSSGVWTDYYADGTINVWERRWYGWKQIKKRNNG